ncbi:hypothetical protein LEP1GSC050_0155 [Leptospira broomii serovar Hurstbridge str. 5399]|uniref:Uncharacterized protein n=1 Tax=Leptospira broomii serovar Hurstbridge str. 5399 TaxID=1049789 RepID=T0GHC7_9LEPT|nr:hypothetical protein [Leptospira broomii]EQA46249.1 hypothetical protein LEP1GSC050_0155 [Leptospira broomii serovar Hurstbridge str. 5399]
MTGKRAKVDKREEELISQEYFHLHKTVEAFDSRGLTIKAWSVTLSMAGIGTAILESSYSILLLSAGSAFLFWIIEGLWKSFQYAYYLRIRMIEAYFSGENKSLTPFQISTSWSNSWRAGGWKRLLWILTWPHIFLPHLAIVLTGPLLYAYFVLR